jgi:hypothetical protein
VATLNAISSVVEVRRHADIKLSAGNIILRERKVAGLIIIGDSGTGYPRLARKQTKSRLDAKSKHPLKRV